MLQSGASVNGIQLNGMLLRLTEMDLLEVRAVAIVTVGKVCDGVGGDKVKIVNRINDILSLLPSAQSLTSSHVFFSSRRSSPVYRYSFFFCENPSKFIFRETTFRASKLKVKRVEQFGLGK